VAAVNRGGAPHGTRGGRTLSNQADGSRVKEKNDRRTDRPGAMIGILLNLQCYTLLRLTLLLFEQIILLEYSGRPPMKSYVRSFATMMVVTFAAAGAMAQMAVEPSDGQGDELVPEEPAGSRHTPR